MRSANRHSWTLAVGVLLLALAFHLPAEAKGPELALPAPVTDADYYDDGAPDPMKVELGKLLFFDKKLSGNQNISCGTCHHALTDTGDGLSLPIGEGGRGTGIVRDTGEGNGTPVPERVPRNAPHVFNLGAREFEVMFHDGRVAVDPLQPSGFQSPAGDDLPMGLENVLAAQAMFPVTSGTEMAGQPGENPIADAAGAGNLAGVDGVWAQIAERLSLEPDYVDLFVEAFPDVNVAEDISYVHVANAMAAFEAFAWRADNSPFDRYLRGEGSAMTPAQKRGMHLFYKKAGCGSCHSGAFQTDHEFYAIAMPQIGPGKGNGPSGHEDFGRNRETGMNDDMFAFRTPSLRNVVLTGPWGHDGAYDDLHAMVEHHLDPVESLMNYEQDQAVLPSRDDLDALDYLVMNDPAAVDAIAAANELEPVRLNERQLKDLMEFLFALTDPNSIDLRGDVPRSLPGGTPLAD